MVATVYLVLILSIYWIRRRSIADAVLDIYLPMFLLFSVYGYRIPHLPAINFGDAALIPIAIALLIGHWREWQFHRTDLWIALFFLGACYSEILHSDRGTAGLVFFSGLFQGIMPYILGKLLLEKGDMRERFARRFVYIAFFVAIVSIWEFRMGRNLFMAVEGAIFGRSVIEVGQIRNGLVRVAATFGGCIQAGIMFAAAWLFSLWLRVLDKSRGNEPKYWGLRRSTILSIGAAGGVLMANSRGPLLMAILAYLIARIGKARNMGRTAIATLVLSAAVGTVGYIKVVEYTKGSIWDAKTGEQESAIYRRILLDEYKPYVAKGGLFGYGVVARPVVPGMFSIDNAFLNIQLVQGNLGLWMFVLMGAESLLAACLAARRATQRTDVYFAICICGVMAGLLLCLATVWLGPPMNVLFFLLLGWSQSLRQTESGGVMLPQPVTARFSFRRTFA